MTREEKEQTGKYVLQMARLLEDGCYQQEMLLKAVHIIDEALEQEPTTKNDLGLDCISRADARKAIIDHQYSANFCEEHNIDHSINTGMALIALSDLPPVTSQEPRWIPVSERLPEEWKSVLVCYKSQGGIAQCVSERLINMDGSNRWSALGGQEPIAWMPLPKPYEPRKVRKRNKG